MREPCDNDELQDEMADYRIEALPDEESGKYFLQVFCSSKAITANVRTKPIYDSLEEAQRLAGETITAVSPKTRSRNERR